MWYVIVALLIALAVTVKFSLEGGGIPDKALSFFLIGIIATTIIIVIIAGG